MDGLEHQDPNFEKNRITDEINELGLLKEDLLNLRKYHYDRQESKRIKKDSVKDKDWFGLIEEIRKSGLDGKETKEVARGLVNLLKSDHPEDAIDFFRLMRLASTLENGRSDYHVPVRWRMHGQEIASQILETVINTSDPTEETVVKVKNIFEKGRNTAKEQSEERIKKIKKEKRRLRKGRLTKEFVEEEIWSDIENDLENAVVRSVNYYFNFPTHDESNGPHFFSKKLNQFQRQGGNVNDRAFLIEDIRKDVEQKIKNESLSEEATKILAIIDPELALSESVDNHKLRKETLLSIARNEPEILTTLSEFKQISKEELSIAVEVVAAENPKTFLSLVKRLDIPKSDSDRLVELSISNVDLTTAILAIESNEYINSVFTNATGTSKIYHRIDELLSSSRNDGFRLLVYHELSKCRHGLADYVDEKAAVPFLREAERIGGELASKFSFENEDDINELISSTTTTDRQYQDSLRKLFVDYPDSLQFSISIFALMDQLKDQKLREVVIGELFSLCPMYKKRIDLPNPMKRMVSNLIFQRYGVNFDSLNLVDEIEALRFVTGDNVTNLRRFFSEQIELYQAGKYPEDQVWQVQQALINLVNSNLILEDSDLQKKIIDLCFTDEDFFLSIIDSNPDTKAGLKVLITDEQVEALVLGRTNLTEKLEVLEVFATFKEEHLINKIYWQIEKNNQQLKEIGGLNQLRLAKKVFGVFVISERSVKFLPEILKVLTKKDVEVLEKLRFFGAGSIDMQVSQLWIAKYLQTNGVSIEESLAWANRTCRKYTDAEYDLELNPAERQRFKTLDRFFCKAP